MRETTHNCLEITSRNESLALAVTLEERHADKSTQVTVRVRGIFR